MNLDNSRPLGKVFQLISLVSAMMASEPSGVEASPSTNSMSAASASRPFMAVVTMVRASPTVAMIRWPMSF